MKILEPKSSGSSVLRAELPEAYLICKLENRSAWIVIGFFDRFEFPAIAIFLSGNVVCVYSFKGKTHEKNKRVHLNRTLGGHFYNSDVAFDTDAGAAES